VRIGVIGSGKIGGTAARLFADAGHEVAIANSRGPESLAGLAEEIGAQAATVEDAARFGDVVLVAIPLRAYDGLPADAFAGKVVVDANNYYASRDGNIPQLDSDETTSTELLAKHLKDSKVVKGFNTLNWKPLGEKGKPDAPAEERLVIYVAGDDEAAKAIVKQLIDDIGFAPLDTGSLAEGGRRQQPGSPIYGPELTPSQAEEALAK
jgi:8-hydroxy-5-deazaflavin:NADPH oxidoreductase